MSNEKIEIRCHQFRTSQRKGYGANLNKIHDGVLNFPKNVAVIVDFGNIKNSKNIQYFLNILNQLDR